MNGENVGKKGRSREVQKSNLEIWGRLRGIQRACGIGGAMASRVRTAGRKVGLREAKIRGSLRMREVMGKGAKAAWPADQSPRCLGCVWFEEGARSRFRVEFSGLGAVKEWPEGWQKGLVAGRSKIEF